MSTTAAAISSGYFDDVQYDKFLSSLRNTFDNSVADRVGTNFPESTSIRLFTTENTDQLFNEVFLPHLPAADRHIYNCHTCRSFMKNYGGLVTIDERGVSKSIFWCDSVPDYFRPAISKLNAAVEAARVTGVFYSSEKTWGVPKTPIDWTHYWTHMAVTPPAWLIHNKKAIKNAYQLSAEKLEDFRNMKRALHEISPDTLTTALGLLQTEALYRSEKVLGVAEWLKRVQDEQQSIKNSVFRTNLLWRAVATAPVGYCHPRSSMIGTLLDDIASGMNFETVQRRFHTKMNPTVYQRPQVAPGAQNIKRAEEIVAQLGIAESFKRRYARLDDIQTIWQPKEKAVPNNGIFGHLKAKDAPDPAQPMKVPPINITAEKFRRTILPKADAIELFVTLNGNFTALLTTVNPEAPPILQWDHVEQRNPVSAYVYNPISSAISWGLMPNAFRKVNAISLVPSMWNNAVTNQKEGMILILDGARDSDWQVAGSCLFPEILKSELREVRATIEAYSASMPLSGFEQSSACGVVFTAGNNPRHLLVRVTTGDLVVDMNIDRWD